MNSLYVAKNEDDGIEARVFLCRGDQYSVVLHDTDSGETLQTVRIFPELGKAKSEADRIANGHGPKSVIL